MSTAAAPQLAQGCLIPHPHTRQHPAQLDASFCAVSPHQGMLRGFDQATNLVLADAKERVFSSKAGVEIVPLGLYMVRGDNV